MTASASKEENIWAWVEDKWQEAERESWAAGCEKYRQGDCEAALRAFEEAGTDPRVLFNLGVVHTKLEQYEYAEALFERVDRVVREKPHAVEGILVIACAMRGACLHFMHAFSSAVHEFSRALMLLANRESIDFRSEGLTFTLRRSDVLFNRALAMVSCGRFDDVLSDLKFALEDAMLEQREAEAAEAAGHTLERSTFFLENFICTIDDLACHVTRSQFPQTGSGTAQPRLLPYSQLRRDPPPSPLARPGSSAASPLEGPSRPTDRKSFPPTPAWGNLRGTPSPDPMFGLDRSESSLSMSSTDSPDGSLKSRASSHTAVHSHRLQYAFDGTDRAPQSELAAHIHSRWALTSAEQIASVLKPRKPRIRGVSFGADDGNGRRRRLPRDLVVEAVAKLALEGHGSASGDQS